MDAFDKIICRTACSLVLAGIFLSVVLTDDGANAAGWQGTESRNSSGLRPEDRQFIESAERDGLAQIELGKLAVRKSSSKEVKTFGQRMMDDHARSNEELRKVAESKGAAVPTQPTNDVKPIRDRLSKLSGTQFDNAYMAEMLKAHKITVAKFGDEAKTTRDPDLKRFASAALSWLQGDLKQAETIAPTLKAGTPKPKPSAAVAQAERSSPQQQRRPR